MSIVKMANGKSISRSSSTTGIVEAEHIPSPESPRRNSRKSSSSVGSTKKKSRKASSTSSTSAAAAASADDDAVKAAAAAGPSSNAKSKSHRKSPFDRRGKHVSHMFGAMIFNSLSLLSLLAIAVTLTVLAFYVWAGVFYVLTLLMLTKVGVDGTKEIRTEIRHHKNKDGKNNNAANAATTPVVHVAGGENPDFSWQRFE